MFKQIKHQHVNKFKNSNIQNQSQIFTLETTQL